MESQLRRPSQPWHTEGAQGSVELSPPTFLLLSPPSVVREQETPGCICAAARVEAEPCICCSLQAYGFFQLSLDDEKPGDELEMVNQAGQMGLCSQPHSKMARWKCSWSTSSARQLSLARQEVARGWVPTGWIVAAGLAVPPECSETNLGALHWYN